MKLTKTIITTLLFLEAFIISGAPLITNSRGTVGKNLITGKEIQGAKYEFNDQIFDFQLDSAAQTLTLQLRGVKKGGKYYTSYGNLAFFDLKTKEIRWSIAMNYGSTEVEQYENILLWHSSLGSTERLNLTTGDIQWYANVVPFATIPAANISLGYKYYTLGQEFSKKLSCIDLSTGKVLWERPLDRTYGWNGIVNLNDTAVIIKSAGLHYINLRTGKGWDYEMETGVKDYSKVVGANVAGAVLGLLTGSFIITTGHDLVSNLVSNLKKDSSNLYFASKDFLTCLSNDGQEKWKVELPKETSHSSLLLDSTRIILINNGEARYNGKKCNYGKPYIAIFNRSSGTKQYQSIFDFDKNPLLHCIKTKDTIDLFFKDRAIRYSIKTGSYNVINFDNEQIGNLEYAIDESDAFLKSDSLLKTLHSLYPKNTFLQSNNGKVVKLDKNLSFEKDITLDELYFRQAQSDKYTFLYHDSTIFVTNTSNKVVAELNIGRKAFVIGKKLYGIDGNKIVEIDLERDFE